MTKKYIVNPELMVDWYYDPTAEETEEALLIMAKNLVNNYLDHQSKGGVSLDLPRQTFESLDSIPPSILEKSSYDSWMKNHQDGDKYAELDPSECVLGQDESDKKRQPMPLNKQVYFQDYYHGIIKNASASEKRQEELYFDTSEEISPFQIAMTIYEYENPNHVLARDEMAKVVERKSFEGWQEKNPNEVIHMAEDNKPEEELLLRAEQVQTLRFFNKDAIKLTSDQIDNPEDPDFNQVMDLVFNIKSRKQLANFIRSANIEQKDKFLEAGVDELLQRLDQSIKERKQDKPSNPGNTMEMG